MIQAIGNTYNQPTFKANGRNLLQRFWNPQVWVKPENLLAHYKDSKKIRNTFLAFGVIFSSIFGFSLFSNAPSPAESQQLPIVRAGLALFAATSLLMGTYAARVAKAEKKSLGL